MNKINSIQTKILLGVVILITVAIITQIILLRFFNPQLVIVLSTLAFVPIGLIMFRVIVLKKITNFNKLMAEFKKDIETGKRLRVEGDTEFKEIITEINQILDESEMSNKNLEIFRIAIENSSDHITITDPDGTIQFVNREAERLTGYKKAELIGKNPRVWGGQMKPEFYKKMWDTIRNKKQIFDAEFTNKRRDGTLYPVRNRIQPVLDEEGNIKQFIEVERDISLEKRHLQNMAQLTKSNVFLEQSRQALSNVLEDAKDLEEKLKHEKEGIEKKVTERTRQLSEEKIKLSASINSLTLGFIMTDVNNNIALINQSARNLLCRSKNAPLLIVEECTLTHIEDELQGALDLRTLIGQVMTSKKPIFIKELEFEERYLRILITPITTLAQILGTVIIVDDITEAKLLERSKDEFFSIASHELRTPLTAIRGNTSMIKQYYAEQIKDPELKTMIDDINKSSIRLIHIVNDFLDLSRLELGKIVFKKEGIDIVNLIHSVIKEYDVTRSRSKLYIHFQPPNELVPEVLGDKDRERQILVNLIGNGMKYSEEGGITISLEKNGNFIKVLVTDTGKGIAPENQKLLFRKFQQAGNNIFTRDSSQSTGLGLYISRLMAEGMGGEVLLEKSEVGVGSTFSLSLPINAVQNIKEQEQATGTPIVPAVPPVINKQIIQ